MFNFLSLQIDYVLFLNGLSLVTLAAVSFFVLMAKNRRLPWIWLGIFSLITGMVEWLSLIAKSLGDNTSFLTVRRILTILAFLFLVEFGRAGIKAVCGKGFGRWVYFSLCALAIIGGFYYIQETKLSLIYILSVISGLWAASALFFALKNDSKHILLLVASSSFILIYTITGGRLAARFPFSELTIIVIRLIQTVSILSGAVAIIVWNLQDSSCKEGDFRYQIRSEYTIWAATTLTLLVVFGWVATSYTGRYVENQAREKLFFRILTVQSSIQTKEIAALSGSISDKGTDNYEQLQHQLHQIHIVNGDCKFIYILGVRDNKVFLYASSEPENSPDYSPPGYVCTEATSLYLNDIMKGKAFIKGPYQDKWGNWVSGLAPIRDDKTHKIIAFVGMDINADKFWIHEIAVYRLAVIIVMLIFSLLLVYLFISLERNKESDVEIAELQIESVRLENEKRLRNITSALGEGVYVVDKEGRLTFMNPEAERMLGWREEDLLGKKIHPIIRCSNLDGTSNHCNECKILKDINAGACRSENDVVKRKDGAAFPISYVSTALIEEGEIIGSVTAFRDITERKQTEEALRQSEERYRDIFENANDLIQCVGADGRFIYTNQAWQKALGYSEKEQENISLTDILYPDNVPHCIAMFNKVMAGQELSIETTFVTKDGRLIDVEGNVSCRWEHGMPMATRGIFRDITERKYAQKALEESERRFRMILEKIHLVAVMFNVEGNIMFCNDFLLELTGRKQKEVIGRSWFDVFVPPKDHQRLKLAFQKISSMEGTPTVYHTDYLLTVQGEQCLIAWNSTLLRDSEDNVACITCIGEDITERKRAEEALRESEERYRALFEKTSNPIFVIDKTGKYIDCNDAAVEFLEGTRADLLEKKVWDTVPPGEDARVEENKALWEKGGIIEAEYFVHGKIKILELSVTPLQSKNIVFGLGKDITERKQAEKKIKYLAYNDTLTGLPNRVLFKDRLNLALAHAHRNQGSVAVLFLDLDRFKAINDTLGHDVGDHLLQEVAKRLKNCAREDDTVARLGGDEFTMLLTEIEQLEDATNVAQRILESFKRPIILRGRAFYITSSIGVTIYPDDGVNADTLLKNADTAMYRAKEQGRNNYQLFAPSMNAKALERMELENSLRNALERKEFILHYQPQVNVKTGKIVGVEALMRWQNPHKGLVPPMEFIPLAEETGLIVPIGEWVIREACAQNKAWQDLGCQPICVAVNLSARQFQQKSLVQTIDKILKETGLAPHYLELEITESIAMQDLNYSIAVVNELKEMGIRISIDDFGTGYSSLNYLKRFPCIDTLKIDRTFIKDITTDSENKAAALVATMIVLAQNLKLKVVAEGVETEEQLAFLKQKRCDEIQGYLFSKPVSAEIFKDILAKQPFSKKKPDKKLVAASKEK